MLSTFTLIYIYTKASHTLKKWDFSSTLDRANHSVSAFFFCVVRAWKTCSVRRKIKYWSKFFGLSFKYLRDFSCGSHIMRQKYIQISFLSFTLTRHSQSIIKNQYLHYLIFFYVTTSQFTENFLRYYHKLLLIQKTVFWGLFKSSFEKIPVPAKGERKITILSAGLIWQI